MASPPSIPIVTITSAGCSVPAFQDIKAALVANAQNIYGSGINLDDDTQDGQLIGIYAQAVLDVSNAIQAAVNSFSPASAQGAGLSSVVQINGLQREGETNSTVDVYLSSTGSPVVTNGELQDPNGVIWDLPTPLTITSPGVTVTVTSEITGAVALSTGITMTIQTPVSGWTSAVTTDAAVPGQAVEQDGALRQRQASSTSAPAQTTYDAVYGALKDITGVTRSELYENDTNATDANGIPSRNIAAVVEGGSAQDIVNAIAVRKTLGGPTFGTSSGTFTSPSSGNTTTINYSRPSDVQVGATLALKALTNYNTNVAANIQTAVVNFFNVQPIGARISWAQVLAVVVAVDTSFLVETIAIGVVGSSYATADLTLAWNQVAVASASNVVITAS
jgi:uncharacterized phage protein gp47/JayE